MDLKLNIDDCVRYPNFKSLVSDVDWQEFFEGKSIHYQDPLNLALIRSIEALTVKSSEE